MKSYPLPHLRAERLRRMLSMRDLSARSGVSRETLVDLERGRRGAYPVTIRKLAAALEVDTSTLTGEIPDS